MEKLQAHKERFKRKSVIKHFFQNKMVLDIPREEEEDLEEEAETTLIDQTVDRMKGTGSTGSSNLRFIFDSRFEKIKS
jgi:hypothetical protein